MGKSAVWVLMMLVLVSFLDMACLDDVPLVSEHLGNQKIYTQSPPTVSMDVSASQACDHPLGHVEQKCESRSSPNINIYKAAATIYQTCSLDMKDEAEQKLTRTEESRTSLSKEDSSTIPDTAFYSAKDPLGDVMDDEYIDVVASKDMDPTTTESDLPRTDSDDGEDTTAEDVEGSVEDTAIPAITKRDDKTTSKKDKQKEEFWWAPLAILGVFVSVGVIGMCICICISQRYRRRGLDPDDGNGVQIRLAWL